MLRAVQKGAKEDLSANESEAIARYLFWNQRVVAVALTLLAAAGGGWLLSKAFHVDDVLLSIARHAIAFVG